MAASKWDDLIIKLMVVMVPNTQNLLHRENLTVKLAVVNMVFMEQVAVAEAAELKLNRMIEGLLMEVKGALVHLVL